MPECPGPRLVRADNFTPVARTPWGGTRLRQDYKHDADLTPDSVAQQVVGESWEISVEPDFPAKLQDDDEPLSDWISRHAAAALGEEARRGRCSTALLVKLLDTAAPLSLQIHPADDYAGLAAGEAGKPETWYVARAEPEAGLYLGFQPEVTQADVEWALSADTEGSFLELVRFVPVTAGDFFVIEAGTPHAVGAGLTLVEPQHVLPGRRGLTYRYWDWNRRYDAQGMLDPNGRGRALHLEDALAVTRWDVVSRPDFIDSIRLRSGPADREGPATVEPLCGTAGGLPSRWLQVWRAHGRGTCDVPAVPFLRSLTVLEGSVSLRTQGMALEVTQGRSAVLPACCDATVLELRDAHAVLASVA